MLWLRIEELEFLERSIYVDLIKDYIMFSELVGREFKVQSLYDIRDNKIYEKIWYCDKCWSSDVVLFSDGRVGYCVMGDIKMVEDGNFLKKRLNRVKEDGCCCTFDIEGVC